MKALLCADEDFTRGSPCIWNAGVFPAGSAVSCWFYHFAYCGCRDGSDEVHCVVNGHLGGQTVDVIPDIGTASSVSLHETLLTTAYSPVPYAVRSTP